MLDGTVATAADCKSALFDPSVGSSPTPTTIFRGIGTAVTTPALQAGTHRFESGILYHFKTSNSNVRSNTK